MLFLNYQSIYFKKSEETSCRKIIKRINSIYHHTLECL